MRICYFLSLTLFAIEVNSAKKDNTHQLPSYFPTCYRNDPNLAQCTLNASEILRPYFKVGIPELKIPSFEPFLIPLINFKQGSKSFSFDAILTDNLAYGLTGYKFTKIEFDQKSLRFICEAHIENLKVTGKYNLTGQLLFTAIQSQGNYTAKIKSGDIQTIQQAELQTKNGNEYLVPRNTNSTINVNGPVGILDGLFDNNPQLKEAVTRALQDNIGEIFEELKPAVEGIISRTVEDILFKPIGRYIPYDTLWPLKEPDN